ncbi:TPA: hypothetical protein N0F65_011934 [Lagenidium giganteum]|uniref:Retroviral polymerase SH3-like domain-containing protein n=1 Tax=Lagenidium giganteum TaxID=4803 RepID=A0AAV2YWS5_9STRA|nr:TPA: hypothetical protein N0F65_011934 [Lagenidium giganteum]
MSHLGHCISPVAQLCWSAPGSILSHFWFSPQVHKRSLPPFFLPHVALTIYIKNRLPSPKCDTKTPPSVQHMRVFGRLAYVLTPREKRLKWDPKARECVFVGYKALSKAYRLYDIEGGKVVVSRDVKFDETVMGSRRFDIVTEDITDAVPFTT